LAGDVVSVGTRVANHCDAAFAARDMDPPIGRVVEEIVGVADDVEGLDRLAGFRVQYQKLRRTTVPVSRSTTAT
jgi:hypothetical protein